MAKDIELVFETIGTNYGTRKAPKLGMNLDVFGCVVENGGRRCTQLDRIRFDAEARKAGIPQQMKAVLEKATKDTYGRDTCSRLGYQYEDGVCVDAPPPKPKPKRAPRKAPARKGSRYGK